MSYLVLLVPENIRPVGTMGAMEADCLYGALYRDGQLIAEHPRARAAWKAYARSTPTVVPVTQEPPPHLSEDEIIAHYQLERV